MPYLAQPGVSTTAAGSGNPTTVNVTFGQSVTTGNTIFVCVEKFDSVHTPTINAPTDTPGNTYTQIGSQISWNSSTVYTAYFYAQNVTGGASFTVTVTITNGADPGFLSISVLEIGGLITRPTLTILAATNTGSGGTPTSGNINVTEISTLLIGHADAAASDGTPDATFTNDSGSGFYYKQVTSTGNNAFTNTGTASGAWIQSVFGFQLSSAFVQPSIASSSLRAFLISPNAAPFAAQPAATPWINAVIGGGESGSSGHATDYLEQFVRRRR